MTTDFEMLGLLVTPAQKAKVRREAALCGVDMSTIMRYRIDNVEVKMLPAVIVTQPDDRAAVVSEAPKVSGALTEAAPVR